MKSVLCQLYLVECQYAVGGIITITSSKFNAVTWLSFGIELSTLF